MAAPLLKLTMRTSTPRPQRARAARALPAVLTATRQTQRLAVLQSRLQTRCLLRQLPAQTSMQGSGVRTITHYTFRGMPTWCTSDTGHEHDVGADLEDIEDINTSVLDIADLEEAVRVAAAL